MKQVCPPQLPINFTKHVSLLGPILVHRYGRISRKTWNGRSNCSKTGNYIHHIAMATPPLCLQQPALKPSIFPSASDSQHSFTYLCKFSESSTLISLISIPKSEFSPDFAYPATQNAAQTSPTPRPIPQRLWERVPRSCGPSERWKQPFL
jgi:hypothetical protein